MKPSSTVPRRKISKIGWSRHKADTQYNIFLGYRQSTDYAQVNLLYWCILNQSYQSPPGPDRLPRVFLDQYCLEAGHPWDKAFVAALAHSRVFCPLISRRNIETVQKSAAAGKLDHVLWEWMLALELHDLKKIAGILPLFGEEAFFSSEKAAILQSFNKVNTPTNEKCITFLTDLGVSPDATRRKTILKWTVGDVFAGLCRFQSFALNSSSHRISGRQTDWQLYMLYGNKIRHEVSPRFLDLSTPPPSAPSTSTETPSSSSPPVLSNRNLEKLSVEDVCGLLRSWDYGEYSAEFKTKKVSGRILANMTMEKLCRLVPDEDHAENLVIEFNASGLGHSTEFNSPGLLGLPLARRHLNDRDIRSIDTTVTP